MLQHLKKVVNISTGVELPLTTDICSILTLSPVFMDEALMRKSVDEDEEESKSSHKEEEEFIVSFDLKAHHPKTGEIHHRDPAEVEGVLGATQDLNLSSSLNLNESLGRSRGSGLRKKAPRYADVEMDDNVARQSMVSLVGGTSDVPMLRLDPTYYGPAPVSDRQGGRGSSIVYSPRLNTPRDKHSLLARSLQSKVRAAAAGGEETGLLDDNGGRRGEVKLAGVRSSFGGPGESNNSVRELSRGSRTRLSRYGFDGAISGTAFPNHVCLN